MLHIHGVFPCLQGYNIFLMNSYKASAQTEAAQGLYSRRNPIAC